VRFAPAATGGQASPAATGGQASPAATGGQASPAATGGQASPAAILDSVKQQGQQLDICAFAPDNGESVGTLIAGFPADGPQPPILPPRDGFLFLDRDKFHASFAADLPADQAAFMADAQVPWNVAAPAGAITEASWRTKPSWYVVTTEDRMIPPSAQRTMAGRIGATQSEVTASHSVYVSQPETVATLIAQAAAGAADR